MPRQLVLGFRDDDDPPDTRHKTTGPSSLENDLGEIAESLRPRVLEFLRQANAEVGVNDLRSALGFPGSYLDQNPQANPVNRILKEMRDAGEVVCREFDRGEPLFSLPVTEPVCSTDAAEIKGNEMAKRQLLVAAAGNHCVGVEGPEGEIAQFEHLIDELGVTRDEVFEILITVVEPSRRERESKLAGTSTEDIRQAIGAMSSLEPLRFRRPRPQIRNR